MTDLKPCPFCGSTECEIFQRTSSKGVVFYRIACPECGVFLGLWGSGKRCAEHWNRRASPCRPIKTAPRDGTPVDLWIESDRGGYRLENHCFINGSWRDENGLPFGNPVTSSATHWMPLPEPPEGKK